MRHQAPPVNVSRPLQSFSATFIVACRWNWRLNRIRRHKETDSSSSLDNWIKGFSSMLDSLDDQLPWQVDVRVHVITYVIVVHSCVAFYLFGGRLFYVFAMLNYRSSCKLRVRPSISRTASVISVRQAPENSKRGRRQAHRRSSTGPSS